MFFYAGLFIACFIVAMIAVWLYRSITNAGRTVYKSILPSARTKSALDRHLDRVALRNRGQGASSPWGSSDKTRPEQYARIISQSRSSRGFNATGSGKGKTASSANYSRSNSGLALGSRETFACRDEEFEFAGKTYTVKRRA
ncbi:MAG: hypothetical protein PVF89_06125 [Lysobacterales bacterium]|jgi:hypothetical protein